ncbi:Interferon- developmental regulator 2 [Allomyces arbusculus]|nr:Interferon- developmental regulator 2 [Allomyces arbusculus]
MSRTAKRLLRQQLKGRDTDQSDMSDDASSEVSLDGDAPSLLPSELNVDDELNAILDGLLEKRAATREDHLTRLVRLLGHKFIADNLESCQDTTMDHLLRCIKKDKSNNEAILASKALALFFLTIGADQETRYADTKEAVHDLIFKPTSGRPEPVRCALVDLLAMACFVAGNPADTHALLESLTDLGTATLAKIVARSEASGSAAAMASAAAAGSATSGVSSAAVKAATNASTAAASHAGARLLVNILAAIGLLLTVAPMGSVRDFVARAATPLLIQTVQVGTVVATDARIIAAEIMALLSEREALADVDEDDLDRFLAVLSSATGTEDPASVKGIAQRDRKAQRAAFRDVAAYFDERTPPHLKLRFKNENVELSSWTQLRQLSAFRQLLGPALHVHFLENPLLRSLFGFTASEDSGADRKAMYNPSSEASKLRTQHLKKQRQVRQNKLALYN